MTETTAGDLFRGREGSGSPIPGAEGDLADITAEELAALDEVGQDVYLPGRGDASRDPSDGAALRDRETGEITDNVDPSALQDAASQLADRLSTTSSGSSGDGSETSGLDGQSAREWLRAREDALATTSGGVGIPSWVYGAGGAAVAAVLAIVLSGGDGGS